MHSIEPFGVQLDLHTGHIHPVGKIIQRRLSDTSQMYYDTAAANQILTEEEDRLIYEVYATDLPEEEGQVLYSTTIIYPGCVGDEFHMTRGHFHEKRDRAEVYVGLSGAGYLILQNDRDEIRTISMKRGTVAYVPSMWAHRTANTGDEHFVFFAAWPGDAGHDYGTIEQSGFAKLLVSRDGQPTLIDNPRYGASGRP